jgi:outer membrane protein assembly factor BamB
MATQQSSETTATPVPKFWLRPTFVTLLALVLIVLSFVAIPLYDAADLDPLYRGGVVIGSAGALLLGLLGLAYGFVRSELVARPVLTLLLIVVVGVGGAVACIRSVDLTGDLRPVPVFRWQSDPQAQLQALPAADASADLPPLDLSVEEGLDFPRYRGSQANGVVLQDRILANDWQKQPPEVLWRRPCGGGFSGFAVAGNGLVTLEQRRDQEVVVCYDRATGVERWTYAYEAHFRDPTGNGPRATPTIADGAVFSLGAEGDLVCLEANTGQKRWHVNILMDCRAKRPTWGVTGSPLVWGDRVIVHPGIDPANNAQMAVAAYDVRTGQRLWAKGQHGASYSSPMRATLAGQEGVLLFDAGGLTLLSPEEGREYWRHEWKTFQDMNIIQPLLLDHDKVLISSEAANGAALIRVVRDGDTFSTEVIWQNRNLVAKYANPVALGRTIYGLSNGTLVALDGDTGERLWRGRHYGHGQLLAVNGHLLVLGEQGQLALVSGDRRSFRELARLPVLEGRTWNTPALAAAQLFVRNDKEMVALRLATLP